MSAISDPHVALPLLIVIGLVSQLVAWRLRIPAIVFLLTTGLVLGPWLGVLDPRELLGPFFDPLISFAVAIILFEGGLSLHLSDARRLGWPLVGMVTVGPVVTFVLGAAAAHYLGGLTWPTSAVLAAILVVTGPTVVKPMLRQARLQRRPAQLLNWESIVNDPLGALLAVVALESSIAFAEGTLGELWKLIPLLLISAAAVGGLAGWGLLKAMDEGWIPEHLKVPTIFGGVLAVFEGSNLFLLDEAGLLAVTVMGVVMANRDSPSLESIRHFKEDVATLLVALLFLVMAADLDWALLTKFNWGAGFFVAAVLFVVRPASVWVALTGSGLSWREKALIGWIAPRGVVAAAMGAALGGLLVEHGYADGEVLVPILFVVIMSTVVLHGLTVSPLAARLGLASDSSRGILIVGAERFALALGERLRDVGAEVVFVDREFRRVSRARQAGFEAVYGDVLSEDTLDHVPTERLELALAATDDDHYNSLVCVALSPHFGREKTLSVTPVEGRDSEKHLKGRMPWGEQGTHSRFAGRHWNGAEFRSTRITEEYPYRRFREDHPRAQLLFSVREKSILALDEDDKVSPGARAVYIEG